MLPRATIGAHDISRFQPRGITGVLQVVARSSFCTGGPSRLGRANASSRPVSTLRYLSVACMFWKLPSPMFPQKSFLSTQSPRLSSYPHSTTLSSTSAFSFCIILYTRLHYHKTKLVASSIHNSFMMLSFTLLFTTLLAAFAAAQNNTLDPNSVDPTTRSMLSSGDPYLALFC